MDREKIISLVGLVLVVGAVVGYSVFDLGKSGKFLTNKVTVESVATVNGAVIPKAQYETQLASALTTLKAQGVDVANEEKLKEIRTQVLNELINNELVNQQVAKADIKPTADEIEKQFQVIQTQTGGVEGLKVELAKVNLTEAQLRENIARQLATQAYLLKTVDMSSVTVSDAEITQFYKDYSKDKKDVPPLKELSAQIKQQITANKQQLLISTLISTLRTNATIETNLK